MGSHAAAVTPLGRLAAGVCCLLAAVASGCHARAAREERPPSREARDRVRLSAEASRNLGVVVDALRAERFGPGLIVPAAIEADPSRMAEVGARVTGRVVALRVTIGDVVREGAPLVEIDTVELHQVTTEYQMAVARSRQTLDALARARTLQVEQVGATQDLRRAEAENAAAQAQLREAEEHLHVLGLREADITQLRAGTSHGQTRSVIRAPVEGTVAALPVAIGRVVAGGDLIAVVGRTDRVWASLRLFEQDLPRVRPGLAVTVRVAGSDREFTGTVSVVAPVIDPVTRTAEGRVALDNADGALRPGASAVASVWIPSAERRRWLPREAVQSHEGARVVFVPAGDGFEARPVRIGEEESGRVPVLEGLEGVDRVVVRGAFGLLGELERESLGEEE